MTLRSTIATGLAALSLCTAGALTVAPPAAADTAGCVSRVEYRKVHDGMTKKRVHRIFDTRGQQSWAMSSGGRYYESRDYKPCTSPRWGFVWVDYINGRVDAKTVYWG